MTFFPVLYVELELMTSKFRKTEPLEKKQKQSTSPLPLKPLPAGAD